MSVTFRRGSGDRSKPAGPGCKLGVTLFFLLFFIMGLLFAALLIKEGISTLNTYRWKKTPCKIIQSYVNVTSSNKHPYRFIVQYNYVYKGRQLIDSTYKRSYKGGGDYTKQARLVENYPKGSEAICYVNPSNPEEAILRREMPITLFFFFFPLIFVAIGVGGIWAIWTKRFSSRSITSHAKKRDPAAKKKGAILKTVIFSVLFIAGGILSWVLCFKPVKNIITAGSRMEVSCLIKSSHVRHHEGDDSTTFSVDILYEYEVSGVTYLSNRYIFIGGSSSGYHGKKAIVDHYSPGTRHLCYVNPNDPVDAVLERGLKPIYLILLIPPFVSLIGFLGLRSQWKKKWDASEGAVRYSGNRDRSGSYLFVDSGPVVLKSSASPIMKWIWAIVFCLFWNGIISVFVWQAYTSWNAGHPKWFMMVFLIPFVLVGLFAFGLIFYYFLALFNPRLYLSLGTRNLNLGETTGLNWRVKGRRGVIRKLTITLEGQEEATYQSGSHTVRDTRVFCKIKVLQFDHGLPIAVGRESMTVPSGTMHTFASEHNKINWFVRVRGEIQRWPDIEEDFPVVIQPLEEREMG